MSQPEAVFPANRHALYEAHGYSAAVRSDNLLFVSGQVGARHDGSPEPDFEAQVRLAFANLEATLLAGGCGFDDIIDVTTFHTDPEKQFVSRVLKSTEDVWTDLFGDMGRRYVDPKLVLYRNATQTACGAGQAAMGPFYCPADQRVYLDLDFFDDLARRFHAPGQFPQAYVIAHEIGHHVQTLLGITGKVEKMRQSMSKRDANALSVRTELQADCFAGVWANRADRARGGKMIDDRDVDQALAAASAIGDDRLQQEARGRIVPDSFTHGTSEQRKRWFMVGLESGDPNKCDTFRAQRL